ncbi:hypothetical protein GCM10020221_04820 [Streptomyces thioluteus]|uniref:Uncharacterized protein n=1 Tax=Streptomyces thioluteus TaxID=66431 RepID=A0ABP6IWH0_STRTU
MGPAVRRHALTGIRAGIRDPTGRWLWRTGIAPAVIHRADLLDILRRALPHDALRTGSTVTDVGADGPRVRVEHGTGRVPRRPAGGRGRPPQHRATSDLATGPRASLRRIHRLAAGGRVRAGHGRR